MSSGSLTFDQLREANVPRCTESFFPLNAWGPQQWGNAMQGEAGEAGNFLKKLERDAMKAGVSFADIITYNYAADPKFEKRLHQIGLELADTVNYADLCAARLGINLGEYSRLKFNMVSEEKGSLIRL